MFGIRTIHDARRPVDQIAIREVQAVMRKQFPGIADEEVEGLPDILRNPLKYQFRSLLFIWEDPRGGVQGFAILRHAPDLNFCYLDLLSAAPDKRGGGIGSTIYQVIREEARSLGATGLFFECLPDDPALSPDPKVRKLNEDRLAFYERFGALPITGTRYETPLEPGGTNPPYLVFDSLGRDEPLGRDAARRIVRAILERKYAFVCPPDYVEMVVGSFTDDPVRLRRPRYGAPRLPVRRNTATNRPGSPRILLAVNERHEIHHVRERGYVESPVRIRSILNEIMGTGMFEEVRPRRFSEVYITAVHDPAFVRYLRRASELVEEGKSIYPYTFPVRNHTKPPKELPLRAGYYCIDTFTPINRNAYLAARWAVNCVLTLAEAMLEGGELAYALVRPPGHHAEYRTFGGFCYFNAAAAAAEQLSHHGKVAILDLDYHHGNGQQDIFYNRSDVLTVSLHGPPSTTYPYFSGFREERGEGPGTGFNLNLPFEENAPFPRYLDLLDVALRRIRRFRPDRLVLCLGLDTARGDPTGGLSFAARNFHALGQLIGELKLPTLVVQEGGYNTRSLGVNARHFFTGLYQGRFGLQATPPDPKPRSRANHPNGEATASNQRKRA